MPHRILSQVLKTNSLDNDPVPLFLWQNPRCIESDHKCFFLYFIFFFVYLWLFYAIDLGDIFWSNSEKLFYNLTITGQIKHPQQKEEEIIRIDGSKSIILSSVEAAAMLLSSRQTMIEAIFFPSSSLCSDLLGQNQKHALRDG